MGVLGPSYVSHQRGVVMRLNQVYHGDCLDVMRSWPAECVDLVVTSPPLQYS